MFEEEEEYREDFPEKESKLHVLSNEAGKHLTSLELPNTQSLTVPYINCIAGNMNVRDKESDCVRG